LKKQDSVCFLIPLHEEKFSYGTDIISSHNKFFGCDNIFIVFSNEFESNLFLEQNKTLCYNSIIYPNKIDKAAAIKKKFFGIEYLFTNLNYEYVICIDSDALFLRNADLLAICEKFYINKILFANSIVKNDFMNSIICSSQRFFDKLIAEKIGKLLEDNTLYFWFNEIPIYKKDVFNRFKHKIDLNRIFQDISWYDFALQIVEDLKMNGEVLMIKNIFPIKTSEYKSKAIRPLNSRLSNNKIQNLFATLILLQSY